MVKTWNWFLLLADRDHDCKCAVCGGEIEHNWFILQAENRKQICYSAECIQKFNYGQVYDVIKIVDAGVSKVAARKKYEMRYNSRYIPGLREIILPFKPAKEY